VYVPATVNVTGPKVNGVAFVWVGVPGTLGDPLEVDTLCAVIPLFHTQVMVWPTEIVTDDGTNTA